MIAIPGNYSPKTSKTLPASLRSIKMKTGQRKRRPNELPTTRVAYLQANGNHFLNPSVLHGIERRRAGGMEASYLGDVVGDVQLQLLLGVHGHGLADRAPPPAVLRDAGPGPHALELRSRHGRVQRGHPHPPGRRCVPHNARRGRNAPRCHIAGLPERRHVVPLPWSLAGGGRGRCAGDPSGCRRARRQTGEEGRAFGGRRGGMLLRCFSLPLVANPGPNPHIPPTPVLSEPVPVSASIGLSPLCA
jgi:hypothetical protein